jgi:N-acetylneuraminate synthase
MVKIGNKEVGAPGYCMVVAEIGINHNGDVELAKLLIDAAITAGCDAVKFQKRAISVVYSPEELASPREVPAVLLAKAINAGHLPEANVERLVRDGFELSKPVGVVKATTGDQKYMLELTAADYAEIDTYCKEKDILWFASPWDEESVDFLEQFDPPCYKVASASLTDDHLLRHMRSKGRPIILSTGMSDMDMIDHAVNVLGEEDLILLHCTSVYPTALNEEGTERGMEIINLKGLHTLNDAYPDVPVGFSSHDLGIQPSYASAVLGSCMIEKHITLKRAMYGSDQASSIEPDALERLVKMVRELPLVLGDGEIVIYPEEVPVAKKLRRVGG